MTPTPKLRFVERKRHTSTMGDDKHTYSVVKVLQQWHTYEIEYPTKKGEWKDVPLEKAE